MKDVSEHTWTVMYEGENGFSLKCEDPCPEEEQREGLSYCSCATGLSEEPSLEIYFKLKDVKFRMEIDETPAGPWGPAEVNYIMFSAIEGRVEVWD